MMFYYLWPAGPLTALALSAVLRALAVVADNLYQQLRCHGLQS